MSVACQICGKKFKVVTHRHLKRHGITIKDYQNKFPNSEMTGANTRTKSSKSHIGVYVGKIHNEKSRLNMRLAHIGKKHTEEQKRKISQSNKGQKRKKDFCEKTRLRLIGHPVSENTRKQLTIKSKEIMMKREINYWGIESESHLNTKIKIKGELEQLGYKVVLEKFITINNNRYAIDVFAYSSTTQLLFEVGWCLTQKMIDLQSHYPLVFQVPKIEV